MIPATNPSHHHQRPIVAPVAHARGAHGIQGDHVDLAGSQPREEGARAGRLRRLHILIRRGLQGDAPVIGGRGNERERGTD